MLKWERGAKATGSYRIYPSLVKLQHGFLSLWLKTCLWAELQPWFLSLHWKTCPWAEYSYTVYGVKDDWAWSLIWRKTLMEPIFNSCGEFRWNPEGPVSQIHCSYLHVGAPGIFSDLLRFVQMLKRKWVAESNRKLLHLFIPSKTATLFPEFAVEDLPLDRPATLVPEFTVKDLPLGRTLTINRISIFNN